MLVVVVVVVLLLTLTLSQAMNDGVVPGNRNLDNTAGELKQFTHLLYPNKAVKKDLKAGLLKSFGFGQAGAEILGERMLVVVLLVVLMLLVMLVQLPLLVCC